MVEADGGEGGFLNSEPVVDVAFTVNGVDVPVDHGYRLFAAIATRLPDIHGDAEVGVHPIRGQLTGNRRLALTRDSRVVLRVTQRRIGGTIGLAGQSLDLGDARVLVGVPSIFSLAPHPALTSRLVVIKGFLEPDAFLDAVRRQLAEHGIGGRASLIAPKRGRAIEGGVGSREAVVRRTVRIRDREVVGFAVRVDDLGDADSLRLQGVGVGGRRRFGCGLFVPAGE